MSKKLLLTLLAFFGLSAVVYLTIDVSQYGKTQVVSTAPSSHVTCKAALDYPNSTGYTESYPRPNTCHPYIVFYKYTNYFATGNCGNAPWCNWKVRCPAGASIQTHNSGGGWHYSMSPNIYGLYDGPAHHSCVDANGNQVAPIPGESETYPFHTHSVTQTKVSVQKVQIVDTNQSFYFTYRPDKLGATSSWVDCPGGAYGPYPQGSTSIDTEYGETTNHYHCKNAQQNLTDTDLTNDNPEATPVPLSTPPSFDLVGSGFGSTPDTTTLKDQFVDKNINYGQTPYGTIRCVHTGSDKVYFSTTGTCPAADQFPVPPSFQFSVSAPAGSVQANNGTTALSKFKIQNTSSASVNFEITCATTPGTGIELKGFNPDVNLQFTSGGDSHPYSLTLAANSEKEIGTSIQVYVPAPPSFLVTCNVYAQGYQSNTKTATDTVTNVIATSSITDPSLISYWKFDGNGVNEAIGGPNATAVGNVSFMPAGGKIGGYAYDGYGNDYIKIPYAPKFDLSSSFTIEFWFRQRSNRSFAQDLVSKGIEPNNYNFKIFRQLWNQYNFGPIIAGYTASDTNYWTQSSNPNQLTHDVWHHVAFVKSPTGYGYYLDGMDTMSGTNPAGVSPAKTPAVDIIVGGGNTVDTDFDDLKIYNRALSPSEISQDAGLLAQQTPPPPPSTSNTNSGSTGLNSGSTGLNSGSSNLTSGATGLNSGSSTLNSGATALNSGSTTSGSGSTGINLGINNLNNTPNNNANNASSLNSGNNALIPGNTNSNQTNNNTGNNPNSQFPSPQNQPGQPTPPAENQPPLTSGESSFKPINQASKFIPPVTEQNTVDFLGQTVDFLQKDYDRFNQIITGQEINDSKVTYLFDRLGFLLEDITASQEKNNFGPEYKRLVNEGAKVSNQLELWLASYGLKETDQTAAIEELLQQSIKKEILPEIQAMFDQFQNKLTAVLDAGIQQITVQLADISKQSIAIQNATKDIIRSIDNLTLINDAHRETILKTKDDLLQEVAKSDELINQSNLTGGAVKKFRDILSETATINWCGQVGQKVQTEISTASNALENNKFKSADIAHFEKQINELALSNNDECYESGVTDFRDAPIHQWYFPAAEFNYQKGYMLGYSDANGQRSGQFGVGDPTLRVEALTMMVRLFNLPVSEDTVLKTTLPNVPAWGIPYVNSALANGINFDQNLPMDKPISRLETAELITAFMAVNQKDYFALPTNIDKTKDYKDYETFSKDKEGSLAVEALTDLGIFKGSDDGNLYPYSNLLRSEFATLNQRIAETYAIQ